jgi:hypothetical protein
VVGEVALEQGVEDGLLQFWICGGRSGIGTGCSRRSTAVLDMWWVKWHWNRVFDDGVLQFCPTSIITPLPHTPISLMYYTCCIELEVSSTLNKIRLYQQGNLYFSTLFVTLYESHKKQRLFL